MATALTLWKIKPLHMTSVSSHIYNQHFKGYREPPTLACGSHIFCNIFQQVEQQNFVLLLGRLSPLRSGLHARITSSLWVQSWWSHSLLLHSNRLGSFPVQLTSSKRMGPDPTPKRGTGLMSNPSETRVSPNLQGRHVCIYSHRNTRFIH